jgi:hypothetical protein
MRIMRANVTRAAEGFDRRSFTVAEILRLQDAGILSEDDEALRFAALPGFSARLAAV